MSKEEMDPKQPAPTKPIIEEVFLNEKPDFDAMSTRELVYWIRAVGAQLRKARAISAASIFALMQSEDLVLVAKVLFYVAEGHDIELEV